MLATKQRESKASEASGKRPAPTRDRQHLEQPNPVWEGLALRGLGLQAKLTVSQPNDPYEREADQIADRVMRMPAPITQQAVSPSRPNVPHVQRMCSQCEEEEKVHRYPAPHLQRKCGPCAEEEIRRKIANEEDEKSIQQKTSGGQANKVEPHLKQSLTNFPGGRPLPASLRSFFEPRLGRDLSAVKVHTDARAAAAARSVNALAYTVGRDVVFASGHYAPHTDAGKRLLAHELVHVTQQGAASSLGHTAEMHTKSTSTSLQRQHGGRRRPRPPAVPPSPPARVCGPNVTAQFRAALQNVENTYAGWNRRSRLRACARVLIPVTPSGAPDINGWDMRPLFQGESDWLRNPPVYRASRHGPCATPTTSDRAHNNNPFAAGHENPNTCSNTVQFEGQCWLNGTVNYGMFGVMVRLCSGDFSLNDLVRAQGHSISSLLTAQARRLGLSREDAGVVGEIGGALGDVGAELLAPSLITWAEILIRGYKTLKGSPTDTSDLPVAWVRAFYSAGSRSSPPAGANRPTCGATCTLDGSLRRWHWVWEPVRPR